MSSPKRKVTLYFNSGMLSETQREAIRQDRSVSWIIQAAWKIAREEVRRLPGVGVGLGAVAAGSGVGNGAGSKAPNGTEPHAVDADEVESVRVAALPDSRPARD
jgi:uncharacterized small protein (TIGR04563 family)